MSRAWVVTALAGLGAAAAAAIVPAFSAFGSPGAVTIVAQVAVGAMWIAAGLIAWARRADLPTGKLMAAVGFAWLVASLWWWQAALPFTVALVADPLVFAVAGHLFLAFPQGRVPPGRQRRLVAALYAVALVTPAVEALFWDPRAGGCEDCPSNLLLVRHSRALTDAATIAGLSLGVALGVAIVVVLVRRWRTASLPGRRVLGPVLTTGALAAALSVAFALSGLPGQSLSQPLIDALEWAMTAAFCLVPVAFLFGLLRMRLRRAAVSELMVALGELPPPGGVRDALARALGDPSLQLYFWLRQEERYLDLDGRPVELPPEGPQRAVTVLAHRGERLAALVHDRFVLQEAELLAAVGAAARLAVDNARLQAELRAQLAEVRASRARIVEAGDAERRRLERDLHDGAQQRLLGIRLALRLARGHGEQDPAETEELLAEADAEVVAALEELRDLARGIHPAVLTDEGLAAALASLARRAPVPIEVRCVPVARLPGAVEAAAYFVASEAVANAGKHAHASLVTIEVEHANARVRIEVTDDGVGGAAAARGSGLSGLRDRVEALDGRLRVVSPAGAGTTLSAELPCPEREAPLETA